MKIVIANLKMFKDKKETLAWARRLARAELKSEGGVMVCPSLVFLGDVCKILKKRDIVVAGQNCAMYKNGAYTGETSASQIASLGAGAVVLGHSERRRFFGETNEIINKKLALALEQNLKVVLCLADEGNAGYEGRILKEVKELFVGLKPKKGQVIIAFEPSWAIGSGKNMDASEVNEVCSAIKRSAKQVLGQDTKVLYGGSVSLSTSKDYLKQKSVDGLFIGSASKDVDAFVSICNLR